MNRRELPLHALRSFEAVARHLSFSRAGEELGVTHGAVSRQIGALEARIGVKLFERGSEVHLTKAGQRLFEGIAPAFDQIAATVDRLARKDVRHVLTLNAPPTFTMRWLIPRLSGFQRQHPDIDVRLSTGTKPLRALKMSEVDVVIRRLAQPEQVPQATAFLSGELLAVCAPELLEKHPVERPQDLGRFQLIEAATSVVGWAEWFRKAGTGLPADARFARFEEMFFALQAALDGLGVALIPSALLIDDLAAERLSVPWHVPGLYERDYCHIVSPLAREPALAATLVEWLSAEGAESNRLIAEVTQGMDRTQPHPGDGSAGGST